MSDENGEQEDGAAARLARYTGLSQEYIDRADLRIEIMRFCKEPLRDLSPTLVLRKSGRGANAVVLQ
jgi:carboxypeptidase C (cathepsin A)